MKKAIILCSGGLDSVVTAYHVKKNLKYNKIVILFFNYNQRSLAEERKCSVKCTKEIDAEFREINLSSLVNLSVLNNKNAKIEKISRKKLKNSSEESRKLYVPCRNIIFLVYALALAESFYKEKKGTYDIFIGLKNEGKESYPDTTPEFVEEMNKLSRIACYKNFKIKAPLIKKDKEDIIKLGAKLGVNFKDTFSCYSSIKGRHCGCCLACRLRQEGFYWANKKDSTEYQEKMKDFRSA